MKRNAKKQYLQNEIVNSRNDIRKFWTVVNLLIPQRPTLNSRNCINTANGLINNADAIAGEFNNHFCSIGKKFF